MKNILNQKIPVIILFVSLFVAPFFISECEARDVQQMAIHEDFCPKIFQKETKQTIKLRKVLTIITAAAEKLDQPHLNDQILQNLLDVAFDGKSPGVDATTNLGCILDQMESTQQKAQISLNAI